MTLPDPLTPAERNFWRRLRLQAENGRRINERVLAGMLRGTRRREKKVSS